MYALHRSFFFAAIMATEDGIWEGIEWVVYSAAGGAWLLDFEN